NLFAGRFRYVDELIRMGADIRTDSHHAVVRGVARLHGAAVTAPGIRARAAPVVGGLAAAGATALARGHPLGRGYDGLRARSRPRQGLVLSAAPAVLAAAASLRRSPSSIVRWCSRLGRRLVTGARVGGDRFWGEVATLGPAPGEGE